MSKNDYDIRELSQYFVNAVAFGTDRKKSGVCLIVQEFKEDLFPEIYGSYRALMGTSDEPFNEDPMVQVMQTVFRLEGADFTLNVWYSDEDDMIDGLLRMHQIKQINDAIATFVEINGHDPEVVHLEIIDVDSSQGEEVPQ